MNFLLLEPWNKDINAKKIVGLLAQNATSASWKSEFESFSGFLFTTSCVFHCNDLCNNYKTLLLTM